MAIFSIITVFWFFNLIILSISTSEDFFYVGNKSYFKRIIGGNRVSIVDVPWQSLIRQYISNQNTIQCGAVLVGSKWILTAAHCVKEPLDQYPIEAYFGVTNLSTISRQQFPCLPQYLSHNYAPLNPVSIRTVSHVFNPARYDSSLSGDLVLLQLNQTISMNENIRPIRLPESYENFDYRIGSASGYGATFFQNTMMMRPANILYMVRVPILPKSSCVKLYEKAFKDGAKASAYIQGHKLFCAGQMQGGFDACIGDSGGPLAVCVENYFGEDFYMRVSNKNMLMRYLLERYQRDQRCRGTWKLAGIISVGYHCAEPGIPGLYTDVSLYSNWIRSIIGSG